MNKTLRKKLIEAAISGHCGFGYKGIWWGIIEKLWFTGERCFEIYQRETDKTYEVTIRNDDIKTAIMILA